MKKLMVLGPVWCIAWFALGLLPASALAAPVDKPPAPPGQGECAHGNSGKPCKDDPQPEKGKDCEEHGNKGGVNEDHCKGTTPPPPPTTTEEEPPSTTTTTETSPSPTTTEPPSGTGPSTSPPAPTESSTTTPESSEPGVTPEELEKALDEQTKGLPPAVDHPQAAGELPYTGCETWMAVLIGLGLSGAGLALRRWAT